MQQQDPALPILPKPTNSRLAQTCSRRKKHRLVTGLHRLAIEYGTNRVSLRLGTDPRANFQHIRSPSPPRGRDNFRDNHSPYRDERRGGNERNFNHDRSFSPRRERFGSPTYRERSQVPSRHLRGSCRWQQVNILRTISRVKTDHAGDDWLRSSTLLKDDKKPWSLSVRDMQLMYR